MLRKITDCEDFDSIEDIPRWVLFSCPGHGCISLEFDILFHNVKITSSTVEDIIFFCNRRNLFCTAYFVCNRGDTSTAYLSGSRLSHVSFTNVHLSTHEFVDLSAA